MTRCLDIWPFEIIQDPQFFRGFQILCGSHSGTPLPTSSLVTHFRPAAAVLVANYCHKQTLEIENDYGVPFPVYVI